MVLAAGAVGSPELLLRSGIGPADALRALGLPVVADVPGVGEGLSDHPMVQVPWRPAPGLPAPAGLALEQVLHAAPDGAPGGIEVLPWLRSFAALLPPWGAAPADDGVLTLGVSLLQPESRGRLTLRSADPARPPRLVYGYLASAADRAGMRAGVRFAAELLRTRPLAALARTGDEPAGDPLVPAVLADDAALDGWIGRHLGTAVHLSGSARMGPEERPRRGGRRAVAGARRDGPARRGHVGPAAGALARDGGDRGHGRGARRRALLSTRARLTDRAAEAAAEAAAAARARSRPAGTARPARPTAPGASRRARSRRRGRHRTCRRPGSASG